MKTWTLTLILAGLAMVGPFATDTYLPSFPGLALHFGVGAVAVQQTLSVYLFASAFMILFHGTLSDSFGRRPVILAALLLFTLSSLGAALAGSFSNLLLMRALQGLSAGAGMVIGQAIVRDRLHGADAQRMIAHIMMVFGIAPAIAPVIGGVLQVAYGWRASFVFMACIGVLLLVACARVPESLPLEARHPFRLRPIARNYWTAIRDPSFLLRSVAIGALFGSFALYVASAANFIMQILHLPATAFGWLFIPMIGGFVVGSALSAKLAHRYSGETMIRYGFGVMSVAALANLLYNYAAAAPAVPWAVLPIFVHTFGLALVLPSMAMLTLGIFPNMRGLAASLQNFVQMMMFALVAAFVAPLLFDSGFKLACGMAAGIVLSWLTWRYATPATAAAPQAAR